MPWGIWGPMSQGPEKWQPPHHSGSVVDSTKLNYLNIHSLLPQWYLHFHKHFDFTTFPFILPPGKGHQGRVFFSFAFQQSFKPSCFNLECFLFSFPLSTSPQTENAKRQQRRSEGEPLKIPASLPTSKKALQCSQALQADKGAGLCQNSRAKSIA